MRNLAIIPARSGSKGLKDKNIKLLGKKPLMAYTIDVAILSGLFDKVVVSTDSAVYAEIATKCGGEVPFLRHEDLASDTASPWDVVRSVVSFYENIGEVFDTVTLLQPTSPLRTSANIISGFDVMKKYDANAVIAVCKTDHSPLWSNVLPEDGLMSHFIKPEVIGVPRQSLPHYYRINGALYLVKTNYIMRTDNIFSEKCYATIMSKEDSIDIDDEFDFMIAEARLQYKLAMKSE